MRRSIGATLTVANHVQLSVRSAPPIFWK